MKHCCMDYVHNSYGFDCNVGNYLLFGIKNVCHRTVDTGTTVVFWRTLPAPLAVCCSEVIFCHWMALNGLPTLENGVDQLLKNEF